jgi:hypothetical protein
MAGRAEAAAGWKSGPRVAAAIDNQKRCEPTTLRRDFRLDAAREFRERAGRAQSSGGV